jgi:hypothetical protein
LTIFLIAPLNVLNYVLSDQQTMTDLIGATATDLAKVGIASAVAAGPIVVAIYACYYVYSE